MSIYYIYKVTNTITNEFYYGSRTAKVMQHRTPEEDLWIKYFTSSKYVKQQIKQYGKDAFSAEILHTSDDLDMLYWHEQIYIYYHIKDPLCLNRNFVNPTTNKRKFSSTGLHFTYTDEQRARSSESRKGKPSPLKGIKSGPKKIQGAKRRSSTIRGSMKEVTKNRISKANTGKVRSEEVKQQISKTHTGMKRSPEHCAAIAAGGRRCRELQRANYLVAVAYCYWTILN